MAHEPINALGAFVRQRMHDIGMSVDELADAVGVNRSTIYRVLSENGQRPRRLTTERLHAMANALDVDGDALAALWNGQVYSVQMPEDRDDVVRNFVLATGDLTLDELRAAIEVARRAAELFRLRGQD